jgi:hypothetical protein
MASVKSVILNFHSSDTPKNNTSYLCLVEQWNSMTLDPDKRQVWEIVRWAEGGWQLSGMYAEYAAESKVLAWSELPQTLGNQVMS